MTMFDSLVSAESIARLDDHMNGVTHVAPAVEAPHRVPADHSSSDIHPRCIGGDTPKLRSDQTPRGTHPTRVAADPAPHPANLLPSTIDAAPGGALNCGGQVIADLHDQRVAAPVPHPATAPVSSMTELPGGEPAPPAPAKASVVSKAAAPVLADPVLSLAAEMLDDLERVRIANENRFRQLTRTEVDEDGVQRGLGMPANHPVVESTARLVEATVHLEQQATANLQKIMRKHPLGPWARSMKGVGDKQVARLLASVGDPYWNAAHDRPRTVSEFRSYCGWGDARAQVRRRGEQAKWSDTAKKRVWVIAESCVKQLRKPCVKPEDRSWADHVEGCSCSPYRVLYDAARQKYDGTIHDVECRRCGPAGKPAQPGSERSAGHQKAMAYRVVSKALLKDLWREARRLHGVEEE